MPIARNMATERLDDLEKKLRQLKIEYDIFLVGGKPTPPQMLKNNVDSIIQQLLESKLVYADKFRFNTLVARYNAFKELWRKRVREKEEQGVLREEKDLQDIAGMTPEKAVKMSQNQYVFVTDDPTQSLETVREFYSYMQHTHERVSQRAFEMNFDKFFHFIQMKTNQIQQKYNCAEVEFQAKVDPMEKKVKFSAKIKIRVRLDT